ncbi:FHA domain-containing protein [Corallococcus sp. bb12-1]|uniref:FHA domain-containing protein n=1 Tax=Corallococcus sp. bb12-1 TaxID=2996784 RepID=UPI00226DCF96|nr:FHA domain-containing protein [Corallococcus sp. bb12-1]MCY1043424.1 FHA domain-containing protein [Corallococcus sp. bb12-1]
MVSVNQLRPFAEASLDSFRAASGSVALIQQPVEAVFRDPTPHFIGARTVGMAHRSRMAERLLAMLRDFDNLEVHFLQPNQDGEEFTVGRSEADLVVPELSVSQHHATLRWNATSGDFSVRDAQSMNGTFINGAPLGFKAQVMLHDGATLAFGDVQFLYLRAETLHEHLRLAAPGMPSP